MWSDATKETNLWFIVWQPLVGNLYFGLALCKMYNFKLCKVIVSCLLKQKTFGRIELFVLVKRLTIPLPQHGERKRESESDQRST